jgi:hypothetical protein
VKTKVFFLTKKESLKYQHLWKRDVKKFISPFPIAFADFSTKLSEIFFGRNSRKVYSDISEAGHRIQKVQPTGYLCFVPCPLSLAPYSRLDYCLNLN